MIGLDRELSHVQRVTLTAMFLALAVVSTMLFKLIPSGPFVFLRFSLTPTIVIFSSLVLGPLYGAFVGIGSDLLPAFLVPTGTGTPNFLVTIVYALLGIAPYFLFQLLRIKGKPLKTPFIVDGLLLVILSVSIGFMFYPPINEKFGESAYWAIPTISVIGSVLVALTVFLVHFLSRKEEGKTPDGYPTLTEIGLMAVLLDFVLMTVGLSLAFYSFSFILSGTSSSFMYDFILGQLLLGSPIKMIIIIAFLSRFLLLYGKVRGKGSVNGKR